MIVAEKLSGLRPSGVMRRRLNLFSILAALLSLALLVQLARLFWVVVSPLSPVGEWRPLSPQMMDAATRNSLFASFDPFYPAAGAAGAPDNVVVTSAGLTLFGIRVNEATGLGSAIIAGSDGVQSSFAVGDEILPGLTLKAVAFDHIVLDREGTAESLYLDQSVPAETVSGGAPDASGAALPAAPAPPDESTSLTPQTISRDVSFAPRTTGGKVDGIVVSPKGAGAAFAASGFQPGDVITSVNGRKITTASDLAGLSQQIRPGARISVEVERGANVVPIALILSSP